MVRAAVGRREPGEGSQSGVRGSLKGETTTSISGTLQVKPGPGTSLPLPAASHFFRSSWALGAGGQGRTRPLGRKGTALQPSWAPLPWISSGLFPWEIVLPAPTALWLQGNPESKREGTSGGSREASFPLAWHKVGVQYTLFQLSVDSPFMACVEAFS